MIVSFSVDQDAACFIVLDVLLYSLSLYDLVRKSQVGCDRMCKCGIKVTVSLLKNPAGNRPELDLFSQEARENSTTIEPAAEWKD